MTDCIECGKKLLDAAELLLRVVDDRPGRFYDSVRQRAEHYMDAADIVCPEKAEFMQAKSKNL